MSYANPITMPVQVFSNLDTGAPQITGTGNGELKTLLKACLVTGFEGKQPLGWEMPHEDTATHKAVFRPKTAEIGADCFLFVDNNYPKMALITAATLATDVNTPSGSVANSRFAFMRDTNHGWTLVGNRQAFVLSIAGGYRNRANAGVAMYFGRYKAASPEKGEIAFYAYNEHQSHSYLHKESYGIAEPTYALIDGAFSRVNLFTHASAKLTDPTSGDLPCGGLLRKGQLFLGEMPFYFIHDRRSATQAGRLVKCPFSEINTNPFALAIPTDEWQL